MKKVKSSDGVSLAMGSSSGLFALVYSPIRADFLGRADRKRLSENTDDRASQRVHTERAALSALTE